MKKVGIQSYILENPITIFSVASIVGPKEKSGPLSPYFDQCLDDEFWGEKSWESAESKIVKETVNMAISKSGLPIKDIDFCFAGDLLNQCIASSFGLREINTPFIGLFGACSTFVESMIVASSFIDGNFATNCICSASSHFCSAEKQFRFPLELGNQRPPSSQWTVTGAGCAVLTKTGQGPFITSFTPGKIIDMGIKDANNMGAAMAPAAVDTIFSHLNETGRDANYYDLIITGDLGHIGGEITKEMLYKQGINIKNRYNDCGILIFDKQTQDTHSGGSGCACCGTVFCGYLYEKLMKKELNKILLVATGALMSTTALQQGESISGIAHAISIEN